MKKCSDCGLYKNIEDFSKRKDSKDGLRGSCKKCRNEKSKDQSKKYYKKNRERLLNKAKERKSNNIDTDSKIRTIKRMFQSCDDNQSVCTKCMTIKKKENFTKDSHRKNGISAHCNECKNYYKKSRKKIDPLFKLSTNIRSMLSAYIKSNGIKRDKKTEEILGCTFLELKNYIEQKFIYGMSWNNYGDWHIDHIIPISYATCESDIYKLNHHMNLQPLWKKDNLSKGNRFIG